MADEPQLLPSDKIAPAATPDSDDFESLYSDDFDYTPRRLYVEELGPMINLVYIGREFSTREQCVKYATENGLVPATKQCRVHRIPMRIEYGQNANVGSFVCNKGNCRSRSRVARGKGTWFQNIKISMPRVFYLMYCFAHRYSYETVIFEDPEKSPEHCLSTATVAYWYGYCRETVVLYQLDNQPEMGKIGGPGKVVQIDESRFCERKYNKGHHLEGQWLLGLMEDGSDDLRLEVCPDSVRTADVLVPLIQKHVAEGSIIHTNSWGAYNCLGSHGYTHKKVNNLDPDNPFAAPTGTHTKHNKSQWRLIKTFYRKDTSNHPSNFADIIVEFLWRRSVHRNRKDPFLEMITAVKHVYRI